VHDQADQTILVPIESPQVGQASIFSSSVNKRIAASRRRINTREALGIGYAPKGLMKGYVVIPVRLPTGELTGYIGITEGKVPKEFHLSRVVTFPKKTA
jgi:hypothetical protein